jgi:hypothetical protein
MWFLNLNEGACYEDMLKPVKKTRLVDVNTLDLHKGEESLNKNTLQLPSYIVGIIVGGMIITVAFLCVIVIRLL